MDTLDGNSRIKEQIDNIISAPECAAFWGVYARVQETGNELYAHNADKLFLPASNAKILLAIAALRLLGSDFVYTTKLLRTGNLRSGHLEGSLIIVGSGDPTFGSQYFGDAVPSTFDTWCGDLRRAGVKSIGEGIIGDESAFDAEYHNGRWELQDFDSGFAPPIAALQYHDNRITVLLRPSKQIGGKALLSVEPPLPYLRFRNSVVTCADIGAIVSYRHTLCKEGAHLQGKISPDSTGISIQVPVVNPSRFFLESFKSRLIDNAFSSVPPSRLVRGTLSSGPVQEVTSHASSPLRLIIQAMLKTSNNLYAESLLKTLGLSDGQIGSSLGGIDRLREFLSHAGLAEYPCFIADGSGLARTSLFSPKMIVHLLSNVETLASVSGDLILQALPIGGVDGTLKQRFQHSPIAGKVFAKTGTMRAVRALSGYIMLPSCRIVFSILTNNFTADGKTIERAHEAVCESLAGYA